MKNRINQLFNIPEWNALRSYYAQTTLFNVLHIERKETIHTAFIAWFYNLVLSVFFSLLWERMHKNLVSKPYPIMFYELPTVYNEGGYEILARKNNPEAPAFWSFYTKKRAITLRR